MHETGEHTHQYQFDGQSSPLVEKPEGKEPLFGTARCVVSEPARQSSALVE